MREKYVKGYFKLSRLLVIDFLLFKVLFWSSVKKFKVPGSQILESSVEGPGSWVLCLGSWISCPGSWALGPESQVLGPASWFLGLGSWVPSLGSWVLILDYALLSSNLDCRVSKRQIKFRLTWKPMTTSSI